MRIYFKKTQEVKHATVHVRFGVRLLDKYQTLCQPKKKKGGGLPQVGSKDALRCHTPESKIAELLHQRMRVPHGDFEKGW